MAQSHNPSLITQNLAFCGDPAVKSVGGAGSRLYNQANVDSADVKLLVHGNEGSGQSFTDSSLSNHTITAVGNTTHSTTKTKFSGGSIYFDGVGDYLSVPDSSDWAFGTDDFTIDFWFNPTGFASFTGLIVQNPGGSPFGNQDSSNGLFIEVDNSSTKLRLFIRDGSDMFTEINQTGIVAGTWNHVAVVRETGANKITMYLNGSSVGSSTWSGSESYPDYASPMLIGVRNDQDDYFSGYMDEVRITKGAALWTKNFTPPARRDTLSISDGMMHNGNCVDFDGTDASVNYGDVGWLDGLTTVSVSCWFYLDGTPPNAAAMLVSKDNTLECAVRRDSTTEYSLSINNDHVKFTSATAVATGEWVHVVYTWNSTGDVRKLYVNGALEETNTSGNESGLALLGSSAILSIGDRPTHSYEIDGKMAEVKIFAKELSAANAKELYDDSKVIIPTKNDASGGFLSQTDLTLWAPLTEGAGTIAYDGSGYGRDGTYTGTSFLTGQTGCPQLITGYNKPMLFDGSSDYVSVADSATLSVGSTFTISYWFYPEDITTESYHVSKNTYTGNQKSYAVNQTSAGKTQFRISGDGSSHIECTGDTVMSNKDWHHIVHVFDGGAGTKLKGWVDGTAQTFNQQPNVASAYDSTSILCLGTRDAGLTAPFAGIINEVIIYNSALSDANATALFATGPNGGPLPLDAMSMGGDVAEQISAKSSNVAESTYSYGGITYKTWTYRSSGTFVVPREIEVDVVVVGGGGGGGYNVGGGGGAGGLVSESLTAVASSYTVTVGAGGLGRYASMSPPQCTSGGDSFISIASATTAVGGGRGGGYITSWSDGPQSGGSGGGGRHSQGGAAGTAGQGNAGGSGTSSGGYYAGAGGGGAGAVGANASLTPFITAGDGGNGKNDFINSSVAETAALLAAALPGAVYLAGGGGGSKQGAGASTVGAGGLGGGGRGSNYSTADGGAGQVNTGGGGGAEKDGGSGVVIIRYAMPSPVGCWRNDGASTWTDLSGNGNNGTAVGSPSSLLFKQGYTASISTDAGRDNQGFSLKQKDVGALGNLFAASTTNTPHVNFGIGTRASSILCGDDFTFSTWINLTGGINGGTNYTILSNEVYQASGVILRVDGGSANIYLRTNTSGAAEASRTNNNIISSTTGWTYLSVIKQGTAVNFYLNGVLLINDISGSHTNAVTPTRPLSLGCSTAGTPYSVYYQPFVGDIGSSKIYDRALTQAEIKQNFAARANRFQVDRGIIKNSLIRWLDFGNTTCYPGGAIGVGSGMSSVKDLKTGTEYGILNTGGGITYSSVGGGCFDFAGTTDDKIPFTATANLSACTVSVWVYNISGGDTRQTLFGHYFEIASERLQMYSYGFSNLGWRFSTSGSVPYNTWTNAVMTWDGSNVKAYINGALNYTNTVGAGGTAGGFYEISVNWARLKAKLATGLIYDRALSAAELKHNFDVQRVRFGK